MTSFGPLRPLRSIFTLPAKLSLMVEGPAGTEVPSDPGKPTTGGEGLTDPTSAPVPVVGVSNVARPLSVKNRTEFLAPKLRCTVEYSFLTSVKTRKLTPIPAASTPSLLRLRFNVVAVGVVRLLTMRRSVPDIGLASLLLTVRLVNALSTIILGPFVIPRKWASPSSTTVVIVPAAVVLAPFTSLMLTLA